MDDASSGGRTLGDEGHARRLEGVIRRELDIEEEHSPLVRAVGGSHDGSGPVEQVVSDRACADARRRIDGQIVQLFVYSLEGHVQGGDCSFP